jgi:hypothetical protein
MLQKQNRLCRGLRKNAKIERGPPDPKRPLWRSSAPPPRPAPPLGQKPKEIRRRQARGVHERRVAREHIQAKWYRFASRKNAIKQRLEELKALQGQRQRAASERIAQKRNPWPPLFPHSPQNHFELPEIAVYATGAAIIRYKDRTDVMLAFSQGHRGGGRLYQIKCPSAPVDWCRARLKAGRLAPSSSIRAAGTFTGKAGVEAVKRPPLAAKATGAPEMKFFASTGVIGEPLDAAKFDSVLDKLCVRTRTAF